MANYFDFKSSNEVTDPLTIMSAYLPWMGEAERAATMRYLYGQRAAVHDQNYSDWVPESWAGATGGPTSTDTFLKNISGMKSAQLPSYLDSSSPEMNWLQNITGAASNVHQGMTRQEQRNWSNNRSNLISQTPDNMKGFANNLLNPLLDTPEYGSSAAMGAYTNNRQRLGGLIGNAWMTN